MTYSGMNVCIVALIAISVLMTGCFSNGRKTTGDEQFFLHENELTGYGKKTTIDRIYQLDPGSKEFVVSDKFKTNPPRKIAVLPFDNLIGGNYILNEVRLPRFSKKKNDEWNWTYANRLRRFFFGHLAIREFQDIELMYIDRVLQKLNIVTPNDLKAFSPQELGRILGADALIYGKITDYKNSYYALFSQIKIGLHIECISAEDGSILFEGEQKRNDNSLLVATNPIDVAIASFQNYMRLKDVFSARASEEVTRELVLRIPIVESFIKEEEGRIDDMLQKTMLSSSIYHVGEGLSDKTISIDDASIENKQIVK
ncbi:MAG: DUF799 domain-containing protein [Candidatus Scalindua rubra]|nr:DUF799 domain-containing protein [Candidatus Scalindua rubra]TWU38055.1 hypothetical protein S225a_01020 [Candidatus Brocadiaceae bacterium S225]